MARLTAKNAKPTLDGDIIASRHPADVADWHVARIGKPTPEAMPAPAAGEVLVNTASDAIGFNARITAFADGRYVVSWTEGSEAEGNFFSTWFRIYAANGTPTSAPIEYGNASSSDNDYGSFAVLANGNIAAVWAQNFQAIVTRVYNATGAVVAAEQVVATPSTSFPDPSIVALATGYVVAYSSGNDIVYSVRSNAGTVVGTNRYVTDVATATIEDHVDLAALPGGGFAAVWVQETYSGSPGGIPDSSQVMVRLFSSAGTALGPAAAVNAGTPGFSRPSVATLSGGGFVIAWQNDGAAGGADILARRYDASGAPVAAEFTVNAAAGMQVQASVVGLANGGFLIAWEAEDGDGSGIFAQAYDSAGVADGGAFRVNETVAGDQNFDGIGAEAVVQLADGTLVFTWSGNGEGDEAGIFTRRFSPSDLGNIAPDASDDLVSTLPGQPVTVTVLGNDFEPTNAATVTAVGTPSSGSVVINPNGTLTYTPGAGFNGSDSFTYTITGPGGMDTATVTVLDGRTPQALGDDILANQSVSLVQDDASITALAGGGFVASWTVTQSSSFHAMARVFAADGTPLGAEFQVSSGATISVSAVTPLANGGFAVLYIETAGNPDTLYARTYTAAGTPVGAAVAVATDPAFDGIHLTGRAEGGFAIIWSTGTDILGRFHDDSGVALGTAFTVSASPRTDRLPAIEQLDGGGYIAVWQRTTVNGDADVAAVRLDAAGAVVGAEFRPHASGTGAQSTPVVAALGDGGFVILWSGDDDIFGRRYDSAGVGGPEFRVNTTTAGDQSWPAVIALDDGGFIASWTSAGQDGSGNGIFAQAYDAAGLRYGAEFQVNAVSAGSQTLAVTTIDSIAQLADGTLLFSWEGAGAGDGNGVFVRRFSIGDATPPGGSVPIPLGGEALVAAGAVLPLIASLSGGGYVVAWPYAGGSYANFAAQVYAVDGTSVGQRIELGSFQFASEENFPSLVGLTGGGFVLAWTGEGTDGNDPGLVQQFNANGTPAAARVTLATDASSYDLHAVAAPDGGYLVLFGQNSQSGMSAQRFDASGIAVGSLIQFPNLGTSEPGAAFLTDGNLAIANNPSSGNLLLSIYSPAGALLHSATLPSPGLSLSLAALDAGGLVVVWENAGDVFGQRYDAQAVAQGGVFSLATTTAGAQDFPSVHNLSNGGFVVSWQSAGQDGDGDGLYARLFDANGQPASAEFLVNQTTAGNQRGDFVNVTQLENNDLVFTWWGNGSDGSGVYMRRFDLEGPATGPIVGTPGPDELFGTSGPDVIQGLGGNDQLDGRGGADDMQGGQGDDLYGIDDAGDLVTELAGEGTDGVYASVSYTLATGISVEILASRDNSQTVAMTLVGNEIVNIVMGNNGANTLDGKGGADILAGFGGDDIYIVDNSADLVIEGAGGGNDTIRTTISYVLGADVSVETLAAFDPATTTGLVLIGNAGANAIIGSAGADYLDGYGGVDVLTGLGGNDIYTVTNAASQVIEAAGGGSDSVYTEVDFALAAGSEVEVVAARYNTQTGAMTLVGNEIVNIVMGNNGANTLDGKGGADILAGFGGDDIYIVDNSADLVIEGAGGGNDTIRTTISYVLGADVSVETLAAFDPATTTGLVLIGNAGANAIIGSAGADYLDGYGGVDVLTGLGGNDIYTVTNAASQVIEAAGGGMDVVYADISYALTAGSEVEVVAARDNSLSTTLSLTGNDYANILLGDAGANSLDGKGGDDILVGYGGADTFAFTSTPGAANMDQIFGFEHGTDRIALDDAVFTAIGGPGALNANAFVTGTAATDADDRILYNGATGELFYDADGNGAGVAVLFATLQGAPSLGAGDFMVI